MISLRPMRDDEFDAFSEHEIETSIISTAEDFEIDLERARESVTPRLTGMLEKRLETPDTYFFIVEREDGTESQEIGYVWFSVHRDEHFAWLDSIELYEGFRGKGYGGQVLACIQDELSKQGIHSLSLHVSDRNEIALKLYKKSGFKFTGHYMKKDWQLL